MEGEEMGLLDHLIEEDGDIGESDQHLLVLAKEGEIQMGKQAQTAVATPQSDQALDLGIGKHPVNLIGTVGIGIGKVALTWPEIPWQFDLETHVVEDLQADLDYLAIPHLAGRGNNRQGISRTKR